MFKNSYSLHNMTTNNCCSDLRDFSTYCIPKTKQEKSFGLIDIIINCDINNNIHAEWIAIQRRNMYSPVNCFSNVVDYNI